MPYHIAQLQQAAAGLGMAAGPGRAYQDGVLGALPHVPCLPGMTRDASGRCVRKLRAPVGMRTALFGTAGMGEYFSEPMDGLGSLGMASGAGFSYQDGVLGATMFAPHRARPGMLANLARMSPLMGALGDVAAATEAQTVAKASGSSEMDKAAGLVIGFALLGIALRATAGYFAGKAMAPSPDRKTKYAVGGALAATFFGAVGLGVTGGIALANK